MPADQSDHPPFHKLTPQQLRIFTPAVDGMPPKEIARRLRIQPKTVYDHLQNIYRTLGVAGLTELLAAARVHWHCCDLERHCGGAGR